MKQCRCIKNFKDAVWGVKFEKNKIYKCFISYQHHPMIAIIIDSNLDQYEQGYRVFYMGEKETLSYPKFTIYFDPEDVRKLKLKKLI